MKVTVNGKKVVLRERFPVREFDGLRKKFQQLTPDMPWKQRASIMMEFVESWEFDGDPKDDESWGDLDLFSESLPLETAIADKILAPKYETAKNLESGSTTP